MRHAYAFELGDRVRMTCAEPTWNDGTIDGARSKARIGDVGIVTDEPDKDRDVGVRFDVDAGAVNSLVGDQFLEPEEPLPLPANCVDVEVAARVTATKIDDALIVMLVALVPTMSVGAQQDLLRAMRVNVNDPAVVARARRAVFPSS